MFLRVYLPWCTTSSVVFPLFVLSWHVCAGTAFLGQADTMSPVISADFQKALHVALGCGDESFHDRRLALERDLVPLWNSLYKVDNRIEWRLLTYLAHRHFMRASSMRVRGFEPTSLMNESHLGMAHMLRSHLPSSDKGFTLEDSAIFVATIEQFMFDAEVTPLKRAYTVNRVSPDDTLTFQHLVEVVETYMLHWILGDMAWPYSVNDLGREVLYQVMPDWNDVANFVVGEVRSRDFARWREPLKKNNVVFFEAYTFQDAHTVVRSITRSFGEFYQTHCASMKEALLDMDVKGTGRVPLATFYHRGVDSESRFGESEDYLRALGALDETSLWHGKQVVIANYLQAASNCIVSTTHYQLCCTDTCVGLMEQIEMAVNASEASPGDILAVVSAMPRPVRGDEFDDHGEEVHLDDSLRKRLHEIAAVHGGVVRVDGRLFAQWLHYVFPRSCPFPHIAGTIVSASDSEFSGSHASVEEMEVHAALINEAPIQNEPDEGEGWMTQWMAHEELIAGHVRGSQDAPVSRIGFLILCAIVTLGGGLKLGMSSIASTTDAVGLNMAQQYMPKTHFV